MLYDNSSKRAMYDATNNGKLSQADDNMVHPMEPFTTYKLIFEVVGAVARMAI